LEFFYATWRRLGSLLLGLGLGLGLGTDPTNA
jgi:hypothetical protein